MPLRLQIKKKLFSRTERVKSVDLHPTEPWVLSALYSGELVVYNWKEQLTLKSFEVCPGTAIRCAQFIPQKEWIVCGADDSTIRVFHYHTMEKIAQFDAHTDFIRYIAVHPTLPLVLSVSDDTSACLWDWTASWSRVATFEGHTHYVMMCQWNPKDSHIFATASLDKTIKIWGIQNTLTNLPSVKSATWTPPVLRPYFNLVGHEGGVNCIQYTSNGDKPYIASGSDDYTIRIWDYQTKQCVMILTGHTKPVMSVAFHHSLPILITGAEDSLINIWHVNTYRLESSLNYAMGRIWGVDSDEASNALALATDEGTVVLKLSSEKPIASMHGSKIIIARSTVIQVLNVRVTDETSYGDGEQIASLIKEIGSCEILPQTLNHNSNGRLIAICGDGEYVIYTSQALRNQAYGKALEFVWSYAGDYAVLNDADTVTIYHKFKELITKKLPYTVKRLFGGKLLGIASLEFICFYDWQNFRLIRRIDVEPYDLYWNNAGTAVILACSNSFFSLEYNEAAVIRAWSNVTEGSVDGVEDAFECDKEIDEKVESGVWVMDCFVFTTTTLRLHTFMSGLLDTIVCLDHPYWLLDYFSEAEKLYLIDRQFRVISYKLSESFIQYQSAISRRDFDSADQIFTDVPEELHNKLAEFLEAKGHQEKALEITKSLDHKFKLTKSLGRLEQCAHVIREAQYGAQLDKDTTLRNKAPDALVKTANFKKQWKELGDLSLERGSLSLATACFLEAEDVKGLLLIYSSTGDAEGLKRTARLALKSGETNVAFMCYVLLNDIDECLRILVATDRIPEAALFSRIYAPSRAPSIVKIWKKKLTDSERFETAHCLADPSKNPEMFPDYTESLEKEKINRKKVEQLGKLGASTPEIEEDLTSNVSHEKKSTLSCSSENILAEEINVTNNL